MLTGRAMTNRRSSILGKGFSMSSLQEKVDKAKAILEAKRAAANPIATPKGPPSATAELFGLIYFSGALAEPGRAKRWAEMAHRLVGDEEDPHMLFSFRSADSLTRCLWPSSPRSEPIPATIPATSTSLGKPSSL